MVTKSGQLLDVVINQPELFGRDLGHIIHLADVHHQVLPCFLQLQSAGFRHQLHQLLRSQQGLIVQRHTKLCSRAERIRQRMRNPIIRSTGKRLVGSRHHRLEVVSIIGKAIDLRQQLGTVLRNTFLGTLHFISLDVHRQVTFNRPYQAIPQGQLRHLSLHRLGHRHNKSQQQSHNALLFFHNVLVEYFF